MKILMCCSVVIAAVLAGGCSDGGSSTESGSSYSFVVPKVNAQQIYTRTTVDNLNLSYDETARITVTAVNTDGSYSVVEDDPNAALSTPTRNPSVSTPESRIENGSGQILSYTSTPPGSSEISCTVSPHGDGPTYPLSVGTSWTSNFSITCGAAAPVPYTETGTVVGVESVTVPAGTFMALKIQNNLTSPGATPSSVMTISSTIWRDSRSGIVIKRETHYEYPSNTAFRNGYPVTVVDVLQSQS